jgi:hypothetical protein
VPDLDLLPKSEPRSAVPDLAVRVGVAGLFLALGLDKFSSSPNSHWVVIFEQIHAGQWFRYFTGVVEKPRRNWFRSGLLSKSSGQAKTYLGHRRTSEVAVVLHGPVHGCAVDSIGRPYASRFFLLNSARVYRLRLGLATLAHESRQRKQSCSLVRPADSMQEVLEAGLVPE